MDARKMMIAVQLRIATFVEVKNDNSTTTFSQGFTSLIQSHLPHSDYQLLDFGSGRKLERVGGLVVDRPCPGAMNPKGGSVLWGNEDISYSLVLAEQWHYQSSCKAREGRVPADWKCRCEGLSMQIKPTAAGHLGIFPEHWAHWDWLREKLAGKSPSDKPVSVLSLFAYTGATTLALAQAGIQVTHVDASKPTVQWAKDNCQLSEMEDAPIRWIVDDAVAFVKRELRRKRRYEAIILDPPSYGHGAQGDRWEIHRDLLPLLHDCWQLLSDDRRVVLLCGHSSRISIRDINRQIASFHGHDQVAECDVTQAFLLDERRRKLDCGFAARYSFQ